MQNFCTATIRGHGQSTELIVDTVTGYKNGLYGRVFTLSGIVERGAVTGIGLVDVGSILRRERG